MNEYEIEELSTLLAGNFWDDLSLLESRVGKNATFSTSFGMEDQLITYWIAQQPERVSIFTLDTGRLFPETYELWQRTMKKYNLSIDAFYPQAEAIERMVSTKGIFSFYDSIDNRKECCHIRKVEPLGRALKGKTIWISGLRAEQSSNRQQLKRIEWDKTHHLLKFYPLLDNSWEEIRAQIHTFGIPYNPLHDKNFISIGCLPCTRAIESGEDSRAGRWWWEDSKKECGLHH